MQKKDKVTIACLLSIMVVVIVCGTKITYDCYKSDKISNCVLDLNRDYRKENPQVIEIPKSVSEYNYSVCKSQYEE